MQNNIDKLFTKFETAENRKQPGMSNTGKSIANVNEGKNGNFSCFKIAIHLKVGNTVIDSLKSIEFNDIKTKLSARAETSLIGGGWLRG